MDHLSKAINEHHITGGPGKYDLAERLPQGDAKATFLLKALENGNHTVQNFQLCMSQLTTHLFPAHAYREQKRYMRSNF